MRSERQNVQTQRRFAACRRHAARFQRDEGGAILMFSLFMFMMIVFIGGIGVDLMRFETERAKLQSTLDRAVLAAADIEQVRQPKEVVEDYFAKSGLTGSLGTVTPDQGLGFRSVSATASKRVGTHLIHLLGIDSLTAPAAAAAEERVDNVEISLVLDVSGSMANNSRIENLRTAGGEFIDAVFANAAANKVSVSLVPYNGQVNVGVDLIDKYNIQQRHNNSYCVDLPAAAYESLALPTTLLMSQHVVADTFNIPVYTSDHSLASRSGYYNGAVDMIPFRTNSSTTANRWCDPNTANRIRVLNNNTTTLKTAINSLEAVGATSIDLGMRWGTALLDPSSRAVVTSLVAENKVISAFSGRPFEHTDLDTLKVVVLMTDGEHFPNEYISDGYRWGQSPIYRNSADGLHSIFHATRTQAEKFYTPHNNTWREFPWGGGVVETCEPGTWYRDWWGRWRQNPPTCTSAISYGTAVQQTWPQVWSNLKTAWVAEQLYARPLNQNANMWWNRIITREGSLNWNTQNHDASAMDTRLLGLCNMAKQKGIVIYTIAFEAPTAARTLLQNCASSVNHAFDVDGLEISSAFASIATSIRKLRLTQ